MRPARVRFAMALSPETETRPPPGVVVVRVALPSPPPLSRSRREAEPGVTAAATAPGVDADMGTAPTLFRRFHILGRDGHLPRLRSDRGGSIGVLLLLFVVVVAALWWRRSGDEKEESAVTPEDVSEGGAVVGWLPLPLSPVSAVTLVVWPFSSSSSSSLSRPSCPCGIKSWCQATDK